jgi:hypothetical protein
VAAAPSLAPPPPRGAQFGRRLIGDHDLDPDCDLEAVRRHRRLDRELSQVSLESLDRDLSLDSGLEGLSLPEAADSRLIACCEFKLTLGFARPFMSAITEAS